MFFIATSFAPYVDWAVHFGGTIQGLLWGVILLSKELDNIKTRVRLYTALLLSSNIRYSVLRAYMRLVSVIRFDRICCLLYGVLCTSIQGSTGLFPGK